MNVRLRHTTDADPGIHRVRAGRGFSYRRPDGSRVDAVTRAWIESLAIPPAWREVWISPHRDGHLLATGRDRRGRKQYRYHPEFRRRRDRHKFGRLAAFGARLPALRRRVAADLRLRGLPRRRVLAAVVDLLDRTSLRVGSERYATDNGSYGLTTLRSRHATVRGDRIRFGFRGKSGRRHDVGLTDRRLARVVGRCRDLPGQHLFQYQTEDGDWHAVTSDDVNGYLHDAMGDGFSAKDFRTWHGTLAALVALSATRAAVGPDAAVARPGARRAVPDRSDVLRAIDEAAELLGNTRAVARSAYVHPMVASTAAAAIPAPLAAPRSPWRRTGERELLRLLGRPA